MGVYFELQRHFPKWFSENSLDHMKCLLDRIHSHGIGSNALLHVLGHNKVFVPFIKVCVSLDLTRLLVLDSVSTTRS